MINADCKNNIHNKAKQNINAANKVCFAINKKNWTLVTSNRLPYILMINPKKQQKKLLKFKRKIYEFKRYINMRDCKRIQKKQLYNKLNIKNVQYTKQFKNDDFNN